MEQIMKNTKDIPDKDHQNDAPTIDETMVEETQDNQKGAKNPSSSLQKYVTGIIIGIILMIVLGVGVGFGINLSKQNNNGTDGGNQNQDSTSTTTPFPTSSTKPTPASDSDKDVSDVSMSGISWLAKPEKIGQLDVFKTEASEDSYNFFIVDGAEFVKVAELEDGSELINAQFKLNAPGGSGPIRIIRTNDDRLSIVTSLLDVWMIAEIENQKLESVKTTVIALNELNPPDAFTIEGIKLNKGYGSGLTLADYDNKELLYTSPYGDIYTFYKNVLDSSQIYARSYLLKIADGTIIPYTAEEKVLADDQVPRVIWTDGRNQETAYTQALVPGCGTGMFGTVPLIKPESSILEGKIRVGSGPNGGEEIYQVMGKDSQLVKALHEVYKVGRDYEGGPEIITLEDFASKSNHFLWQDEQGDWQIYASNEFAPLAECGKPVVYLYPQEDVQVRVEVGASVRLSEPLYPQDGWLVDASPDGSISYQDRDYSSLYWEGKGDGTYPDLSDSGVVVSQKDLLPTLWSHLKDQGLNQKESADFMEFWESKLPKTPFVRLTWLGTREMDELAPLRITPKPNTVRRIFLEFEGLEKHFSLKPQNFSSFNRDGFTVVEWGGLLINQPK